MSQKILVAMDESDYSMKAVRHVANIVRANEVEITLMSVLPETPGGRLGSEPSLVPTFKDTVTQMETWTVEKRKAVEEMVCQAKDALLARGIPEKNITVKTEPKRTGVARDILAEATAGGYNVIVVGRRGVSGVKEFIFGSVSNKVLSLARNCAVWVVD